MEDQERLARAQEDVQRARRITEFLEMQVWKRDLEPMLAEIQAQAVEAVMWPVAVGSDAAMVAMRDAFNKGRHQAVADIGERILDMKQSGVEAAKTIERLEEKTKEV